MNANYVCDHIFGKNMYEWKENYILASITPKRFSEITGIYTFLHKDEKETIFKIHSASNFRTFLIIEDYNEDDIEDVEDLEDLQFIVFDFEKKYANSEFTKYWRFLYDETPLCPLYKNI